MYPSHSSTNDRIRLKPSAVVVLQIVVFGQYGRRSWGYDCCRYFATGLILGGLVADLRLCRNLGRRRQLQWGFRNASRRFGCRTRFGCTNLLAASVVFLQVLFCVPVPLVQQMASTAGSAIDERHSQSRQTRRDDNGRDNFAPDLSGRRPIRWRRQQNRTRRRQSYTCYGQQKEQDTGACPSTGKVAFQFAFHIT